MTAGNPLYCEALVITCKDWRFQQYFDRWIQDHLGYGNYDRVAFAGASRYWDIVMSQVETARRLHDIRRVIIANHEDCGAYGPQGTFEHHTADLHHARRTIQQVLPGLEVELYFVRLDGTFERIE